MTLLYIPDFFSKINTTILATEKYSIILVKYKYSTLYFSSYTINIYENILPKHSASLMTDNATISRDSSLCKKGISTIPFISTMFLELICIITALLTNISFTNIQLNMGFLFCKLDCH